MRKVVSVDLAGRAYQVDEAGYELLQNYLGVAEKQLADNPDKVEVLSDIESAIATKASGELKNGRTVISAAAIKAAIDDVGPVEGEDVTPDKNVGADTHSRKLFLLPKEEKISGVCAGLAAYFGMDVTIMRILFVILLFITQGFWLLVYIALAIAMPTAETPAQEAEAHGKPVTAQEIARRIKSDVPADAAQRIGAVMSSVALVAARVLTIAMASVIGLVVTVWGWGIWVISLGQTGLTGNLFGFGRLSQLALITALFIVIALPLLALFRLFERVARPETANGSPRYSLPVGFWVLWAGVAVLLNGFIVASVDPVRANIKANDGYLKVGKHAICINGAECSESYKY